MKTKNSPFSANTFQEIWKKHFLKNKLINKFQFIEGTSFYKSKLPALFFNVGKNLTKGNYYRIHNYKDFKNKTFIIYDVMPDTEHTVHNLPKNLKILKSVQYSGFLINLNKFKSIDDYLLNTFSKNTRMKMRKFNKRLDACFDISTKMFFGHIDKKEYDDLFDSFLELLQKKFSDKQISYNNLEPSEWNFYKEVAYPLILEKKASLFVVYNNGAPIAITYNYHTENTLIDAITVFDIDYSKFNMGYVNNLKLISWCFDNQVQTLDFSKGYFDYKKRMCTLEYDFEYHIIYDSKSIVSKSIGFAYYAFFELKAYMRKKGLDAKFHKFTYFIKNKKQPKTQNLDVEITKLENLPNFDDLVKIDVKKDTSYNFLIKHINNFLYLNIKSYSDINVFKLKKQENAYVISSDSSVQQIKFMK